MGDLIMMTRSQSPAIERPPIMGDAEILFFTGVRYYRMSEEVAPRTIVRRRRVAKVRKGLPVSTNGSVSA